MPESDSLKCASNSFEFYSRGFFIAESRSRLHLIGRVQWTVWQSTLDAEHGNDILAIFDDIFLGFIYFTKYFCFSFQAVTPLALRLLKPLKQHYFCLNVLSLLARHSNVIPLKCNQFSKTTSELKTLMPHQRPPKNQQIAAPFHPTEIETFSSILLFHSANNFITVICCCDFDDSKVHELKIASFADVVRSDIVNDPDANTALLSMLLRYRR